ncbi:DeoR/GlpR family DNA-binding transcription regulator [Staphylococcus durrellii]|uniref:DeoR/GlpR family DNA-binding transcription regulator n=1 Tax=Staphylococcus durrellii TaxID=2781773 RepID=UPI00189D53CB|nr:DeoR/GlpR family DNA-binding transcription regulator [Staphylococcus durrellii]MBF7018083.1 DeoR/GlpR transcriptional regulator [Staphylococcus durrellii]
MKSKRILKVEKYVQDNETVSIEELTEEFNVSINTIRRDINELVKRNSVKKVYGGVKSTDNQETKAIDYSERNIENYEHKKNIGYLASQYIKANDVIYIDTGTTTIHILDNIDENLPFTIITNSLDVINKATKFNNVSLFIIGEKYKARTRSFTGVKSQSIVDKFNIKKAFMAATAVNINNGLTNAEIEENFIKQAVIKQSEEKYVLVDHSKINKSTLLTYTELADIDYLITDKNPDKEFLEYCQNHDVTIKTN